MSRASRLMPGLLTAVTLLASGCAAMKGTVSKMAPPPPLTAERKAEVLASFEAQRDTAQLQAAMNRWKEGNAAACQRALESLIERRPAFVDARLQYAELLMSQNNFAAAQGQLQECLRLAPDRAEVHHSLAVVFEAEGQASQAAAHFRRAAQLDPENPLYQFAVEGLDQ